MSDAWSLRSRLYDRLEASDRRRGPAKAALFARMSGRTLLVAAGTGADFRFLPPGDVIAIDFSAAMLRRADRRLAGTPARVRLLRSDARRLPFGGGTFDTVITSCTLCSLADPLAALHEIGRVLRPDGRLLLFEHVRSRHPLFGPALDVMTIWTRWGGTLMNRDTLTTVRSAGFLVTRVDSVFLDVILAAEAVPATVVAPGNRGI